VNDVNDPVKYLAFQFQTDEHLQVSIDTAEQRIRIRPAANWFGEATIALRVTDPQGLSASDTFTVNVIPVDDPPTGFELITPIDTTYTEWPRPQTFVWHPSMNVDPGDSITYNFYISPNENLTGQGTYAVSYVADTTLMMTFQNDAHFYWGVYAEDRQRNRTRCDEVFKINLEITDVVTQGGNRPESLILYPNYPNPFNPETTIRYDVPETAEVQIQIYDVLGRQIRLLFDGVSLPGTYEIMWDGRDELGLPVSTGIYFIRLCMGNEIRQHKMLLIQ
jgi:hypothetical protein